jgi:hypothetical protein
MSVTRYCGRRAAFIENDHLRVTVLEGGGHIAEILDKETNVNPLWVPPWASIEPSSCDPEKHPEYGTAADAKLLAGIMGHNLCLDMFGGPTDEELSAGITPHGEGSVVRYEINETNGDLRMQTHLRLAEIHFERRLALSGREIRITESVESLCSFDRPIGWTQHVTLGPPFLERGVTQFQASAGRSKVFETEFGTAAYLKAGAEFEWPIAPRSGGGVADLRVFNDASVSSGYTAHLMNPFRDDAFFVAYSPTFRLAFGYVWKRHDFPWMGIWEENHSRTNPPWNGQTLTRGMEFGVSPMPESRREMVNRGRLFDVPTYRWLPAKSRIDVEYYAFTANSLSVWESARDNLRLLRG